MQVETIETPELGDRSYVVADDDGAALVIDPQRDLDRVEHLLAERGWRCVLVAETHLHNDYVSGGLELARRSGAMYAVAAEDTVAFDRRPVRDAEKLTVGTLTVTVLATPGHTQHHLSYLVRDNAGASAVFTGGSLLYGSVGRTDLVAGDRTESLTRSQFRSARRLAELPEATEVFPTHGFGSMCSAGGSSGATASTIGAEKGVNMALTQTDEDRFVAELIAGLTAYPAYYAHMSGRNAEGGAPADLSPPELVNPDELAKRIAAGEWVVDLRDRTAFAAAHLTGSIGFALGPQFATYLGWVIPWGIALTLIAESPEQVSDAQRQLVRIGIDRPAGAATGGIDQLAAATEIRGYPRVTFADLAAKLEQEAVVVLDVRRDDERASGGIAGSRHIPLHSLLGRLEEVPVGELWVHCAAGFRASIAASLLDRAGRDVVLIDDDWAHADGAGLPIT